MTVRELYRNTLIELNKEEASALYVEDFLYFANKAVNNYVNTRYNLHDTSQQLSDDLRVLRSKPEEIDIEALDNLKGLEHGYRHLLNCIVNVELTSPVLECEQEVTSVVQYPAKRLTADRKAAILNNSFLEPRFYRPYYDLIGNSLILSVGTKDEGKYNITKVTVEYLKEPQSLKLTQADLLDPVDNTDSIEFPEYVCYEIQNTLVTLILEQGSDPRISTNAQVNRTVGPAPQGQ